MWTAEHGVDRRVKSDSRPVSIVVPTYRRDSVLIATIGHLLELDPAPAEILVVDQTERHQETVEYTLRNWEAAGAIRLVRLAEPSITRAMNRGLCEAGQNSVLFVDDDIVPEPGLLEMHWRALERTGAALVAGRVIQPWHEGKDFSKHGGFHFASMQAGWIREFMGGNFTVRREIALKLGGFDEQFVSVAYNFEAEFAYRLCEAGHRIFYEPAACIHHLKVSGGWHANVWRPLKEFQAQSRCRSILFHLAHLVRLAKLGPVFEPPAAGHRDTTSSLSALVDPSDARRGTFRNGLGTAVGRARASLFEFQQMAERRGIQ